MELNIRAFKTSALEAAE